MCIINNIFDNPCSECCGKAIDGSCRYNCIAYKNYLENSINKREIQDLEKRLHINSNNTYTMTSIIK